MGKDGSCVENSCMDELQSPEIVFQTVTHKDGFCIHKPHQIILDLLDILVLAIS